MLSFAWFFLEVSVEYPLSVQNYMARKIKQQLGFNEII
jgi:hypothetical protein